MTIIESTISGVIQGITELLPVSSSGHLILLSIVLGFSISLPTVAVMHLGTLGSLLITSKENIKHCFNLEFLLKILISIIPAGLLGLLLGDFIEQILKTPIIIASSLIFWGLVMILTDKYKSKLKFEAKKLNEISISQAITVGLGQGLALIPGTSRSGITTLSGIAVGISPKTALEYSFLTGIPLIAASGGYSLLKVIKNNEIQTDNMLTLLISVVVSLFFGLLAAKIFRRYLPKKLFTYCGIYRIILGIVILIALYV